MDGVEPLAMLLDPAALPAAAASSRDGVATVQVLQEEGLHVCLKCRKALPGGCEIVAEFAADTQSKPMTEFKFEAAVPKYLQLEMEPASANLLLPGAPPVRQRMRVKCFPTTAGAATGAPAVPLGAPKPLLMKCRVTFLRDGALVQRCANVSAFPASLIEP